MRNNTSFWKRSLAALLSLVMVLGMLPTFGLAPVAYAAGEESSDQTGDTGTDTENQTQQTTITGEYITLPITIRDFAADGMLFEYNEVDKSTFTRNSDGSITWGDPRSVVLTDRLTYNQNPTGDETIFTNKEPWVATYNATDAIVAAAGYRGIYVHPKTSARLNSFGDWWYCVIIDANGNVLKTLDVGEGSKATFDADMAATYTLADGITTAIPAYSIWAWRDPSNLPQYNLLSKATKGQHQVGFYDTVSAALESGDSLNFYMGIPYSTSTDPASNGNMGIYVWSGNAVPGGYASYTWWTRIVCNSSTGQVVKIIPSGTPDSTYGTSEYKIVMIFADDTASLAKFSHITTDNMSEYQIVTPTCDRGGALFIERTIQLNESNTRGFGLLFTKSSDAIHNMYDDADENWGTITGSLLIDNDPTNVTDTNTNETPYKEAKLWDENGSEATAYATQQFFAGVVRTNLVAKDLDKFGNPRYTEGTVTYLAEYLQKVMATPEKDANGVYNSHHVMGDKMFEANFNYIKPGAPTAVYDLADMIRMNVGDNFSITDDDEIKLGKYTESRAKFEAGNLDTVMDVKTWYDAAYYLLHSTWRDSKMEEGYLRATDGYGLRIDNYNRIHLRKTTNEDGQTCYVFNAAYDNTTFDMQRGEIFNSPFGQKADGTYYNAADRTYSVAVLKGETDPYKSMGIALPVNRWDPLGPCGAHVNAGFGMSGNTYGELTGAEVTQDWSEYYDETNYNLSLEGHAQFVYHQDSNQYFTFTGDDDVYLYINGIRVLDIGGAHGISKVRINLNDVAEYCQLKDGGTYPFDFFYLERHGTAANFGIETNIQIADASMQTTKTGYQNGVNTGYGGPVNKDLHVGYSFELKNDGTSPIYNLTFEDKDINAYVGYDDIRINPQLKADGKTPLYTFANDIYMIHWDAEGKMTYNAPGTFSEQDLKDRLEDGLAPGERIGIYGFKYLIPKEKWVTNYELDENGDIKKDQYDNDIVENISFTNTVYTSATNTEEVDDATRLLHGVADWKVVQMEVPYTAFHVYDWVHKNVSNDPKADTDWHSEGVTVEWNKLDDYLQAEIDAGRISDEQLAKAYIVRCTGSGHEDEYNQNSNVAIGSDKRSIIYTSSTTGKDTVFFKFKGISEKLDKLVFSFEVYTYGVVDNVYVLDYGLSVELAGQDFGFQNNDVLENNHNNNPMRITASIVSTTSNYGTFTHSTAVDEDENTSISSLKYTPNKIINDIDTVQVKIKIVETMKKTETDENGETVETDEIVEKNLDKYTGVEMIQTITTAPASVVYYEENFPGITYVNSAPKLNKNTAGFLTDVSSKVIYTTSEKSVVADDDGYLFDEADNPIMDKNMNHVMLSEDGVLVDEIGDPITDTSLWLKWDDDGNMTLVTNLKRVKVDAEDYLVDESGNNILDTNGQPVMVDENAKLVNQFGAEVTVENLSGLPVMVSNQWVQYETVTEKLDENGDPVLDEEGNPVYESVAGTEQSADQDMNYGSDPNYEEDKVGQWNDQITVIGSKTYKLDVTDLDALQAAGIDSLNDYLGLTGTDSNGTVKELVVHETAEVMFFNFVGTGFEIVSRTTDEQYAVVDVRVYLWDEENDVAIINQEGTEDYDPSLPATNNAGIVRRKPVITESEGGDLYQVPIISITGLEKANYRVSVWAGTTGNMQRVLYIDGIRIYGPLGDEALEYYNPEEYKAEFFEVKQLIQKGQAIYADASETDGKLLLVTGSTLVENREDGEVLTLIEGEDSVDTYMQNGPNNELYLDGYSTNGMIAFWLTPKANHPEAERTLEIGAHRKADSVNQENGSVSLVYGSNLDAMLEGTYSYDIASGTEMYYTIEIDNLVKDTATGKYLVMIGTNGSEDNFFSATLALTSIKVAGYDISFAEAEIQLANAENTLDNEDIVQQPFAVLRSRMQPEEPEVIQIPVNEKLEIKSASVKATSVVSGKANTLTVKAGSAAQTIVVTDAQGNVVEATKCVRKVSGGVATFTFAWNLTGSRGEKQEFSIRVYDKDGLASVNIETVTVTIK